LITILHVSLFLAVGVASGQLARSLARRRRIHEQAAHQMQRTRNEVRNILDHLSSGLITVDRDGSVTRANPPACELLGLAASDLVGRPLRPAVGPQRSELADCVLQVASGGAPVNRGEIAITRDGREVPLGITVNYLEDDEADIGGAVAIFTDLTEVRRMQEHIRKTERLAGLGQLAASIAHEIRNPLGSIRGSAEILATELDLEGEQAQLMELVLKESGRINTIINDFLEYSRMRSPTPRRVDCEQFLTEVGLQIRQHVVRQGGTVTLVTNVAEEDLAVRADPEQLVQVVLNLALNACEAMDYTGKLTIDARSSADRKWCELQTADTGPGVDQQAQEEIFTPFYTTKTAGTGLGLPMVARIVHAHGGSVEVTNGLNGGAVFTVRLPRVTSQAGDEVEVIEDLVEEVLAPATPTPDPV
jgi:two-component system sensor histidine kinase PilS (NtrC family)